MCQEHDGGKTVPTPLKQIVHIDFSEMPLSRRHNIYLYVLTSMAYLTTKMAVSCQKNKHSHKEKM